MMIYTIAVMTLFPAAMIYAAVMDMLTMTIPNKISLALIVGFAVLVPFTGLGLGAIGMHVLTGLLALAAGLGLFAMGWVGGGDVKLFASIALWFGTSHILPFLLTMTILGGLLTLLLLGFRKLPLPAGAVSQQWLSRLHAPDSGIPYGIAIAAGALLVYPETIWVASLTG